MTDLPHASSPKTQKSLHALFEHFYAETVERFPDLQGRFLIVDMNECEAYGIETLDPATTGLTQQAACAYLEQHPLTIERKADKEKDSRVFYDDEHHLSIIFINDQVSEGEWSALSDETEKDMLSALDHELAHLTIENAHGGSDNFSENLMAECIADAYALIRHYQRYGADSAFMDLSVYGPLGRLGNMIISGDKEHFTTFVLDKIIQHKQIIDVKQLSVNQTTTLALRFATEYAPPETEIDKIYNLYAPVREAYAASKKTEQWLPALVDLVLDPQNDYYTFKAGCGWLMHYLATRTFLDRTPIDMPVSYLNDAFKRLKERELKFAQEDILFNMPLVVKKTGVTPRSNIPFNAT